MGKFNNFAMLLMFGFTSHGFAQSYQGPINVALRVQMYDPVSAAFVPFTNGHVFVNTLQTSPEGNRVNHYLHTDEAGVARLTMSRLAEGARLILYGVSSRDSQIRLDCKLSLVVEDAKPFLEVVKPNSGDYIVRTMQLTGASCSRLTEN